MSNYICDTCFKDFKVKSHYDDHKLKRKKPCKPPYELFANLAILTNSAKNLQKINNLTIKDNTNNIENKESTSLDSLESLDAYAEEEEQKFISLFVLLFFSAY